jgi:hypothetical protein
MTRLNMKVVPGSSRNQIVGWLGDALKIKVSCQAQNVFSVETHCAFAPSGTSTCSRVSLAAREASVPIDVFTKSVLCQGVGATGGRSSCSLAALRLRKPACDGTQGSESSPWANVQAQQRRDHRSPIPLDSIRRLIQRLVRPCRLRRGPGRLHRRPAFPGWPRHRRPVRVHCVVCCTYLLCGNLSRTSGCGNCFQLIKACSVVGPFACNHAPSACAAPSPP